MKHHPSRREFLRHGATLACAATLLDHAAPGARAAEAPRKFRLCLTPGSIGVKAGPREAIALAHKHGFEAVEPYADFLAKLNETELADLLADMKSKGLVWGAAGLPVDFRGEDARFRADLDLLGARAAALRRAGVERVGTWISPSHNSLTYLANFCRHAQRLKEVAKVLGAHGQRLGLEYVGTPTLRQGRRHSFVHSMSETEELIAEIGTGNVGLILDSWHWWTAGEAEADLLALKGAHVVSVDLNDAPAGIPIDKQIDGQRELPCATGVIPTATFVNALQRIGYDGPVRAEPFNKVLNDLGDEEAAAAVIASMRKAMELLK